jgi:MarR family 2-MHQ and catechol resistance regulon transcriptional repressor
MKMGTKYTGTREEIRALDAFIKLQRSAETSLARTTQHLSRYNLTQSQFAVLEALHHLGTLSQRDLAEKLLRTTGNISSVLKVLERRGLIERERTPEDNRYMAVQLTDQGQGLLLSFFDQHVQGIVMEMSVLSPAELDQLAGLCKKLGLQGESEG